MRSEFEKAFKKEYPHADYLACLKFDEVENQYKPINEEVEPLDVNFWVCVGVNTGWWAWQYRQTEVDELQKQVTDLDNRATKYALDAMATAKLNAELQKRVDAVKQLIQEYRDPPTEDKTFCHALSIVADELEQALKGGVDE